MSIEKQLIRDYYNANNQFANLVDKFNDLSKSANYDISTIEIVWNKKSKDTNNMIIDHTHSISIDTNLYKNLDILFDSINTNRNIFIDVYFYQGCVTQLYISIDNSKYRDRENGNIWYYREELVYSVLPIETLNRLIVKSKSIDENWYFVKERTSVG